ERYGYSFDGWFTEADGGDLITDSTVVSNAEAHTLFAQWTPLQIEVTFDANGGQDALPLSKNVTFDSVYEALATTERYGYSFNGWFTDTANGTQVSATTLVTRAEAHTLYAQWTPLEVKVTFNANGGVAPVPPTKNVTFDSAYGALATTERYGYIFRGWYTQTTGGDQVLATTIVSNAAAHSLFAQWTPRSDFTVTYFGNGNTSGSAPVDSNSPYVFNTAVKVLGQGSLVRDGYSFQGWATSSGGKAVLSDGLSFVITNHIELYAVWSANPPVPVPPPPAPPTIIINNPPPPPAPPVTINNYPPAPPPPPVVIINNPPAPAPPAQQPPPPPPAVPIEREIPPLELPLAAPITNWALLNLIMTLLGFLLVVITLVRVLSSRRNDNRSDEDREERRFNQSQERERSNLDSEREERKRAGRFWLLFSSLLTIIAVVIFLITQDLSGVMTLFDLWTIAHLVIFCAQIFALVAIAMKTKKSDDEREFEREQVVVLPATY
ncbi:MAG: InlB B-repeat-containing protein, partial [Coriobacteriia bacterium]|nr:InlB B-repeat-containing protein [Coriobacteriia bacterium]